jgi:hemerythrin-like metal-binding protein
MEAIDQQHKMLFDMSERLARSFEKDKTTQELGETLKFMVAYTSFHFSSEEQLMHRIKYPDLQLQRDLHSGFKRIVAGYLLDIKNGGTLNVYEVMEFINKWIYEHVLGEDRRIGEFIKKKGISITFLDIRDDNREDVNSIINMQQLKKLYEAGQISAEVFKKNEVLKLNEYITLNSTGSLDDVQKIYSLLEFLENDNLINESEAGNYKQILFEKLDLNYQIKQLSTDEEKIRHLKIFEREGLLSEEEIVSYLNM